MEGTGGTFNGAAHRVRAVNAATPSAQPSRLSMEALFDSLDLVEITRESPLSDIEMLVGKDGVHKAGTLSVADIINSRLGGGAFNRTCYAVRSNVDGQLQSAIYVHKMNNPVPVPRDLIGNVREILTTPAQDMGNAIVTAAGFYSITRLGDVKGAGEILIRKLHAHLVAAHPDITLTTLSPLRQPANGQGIDDFLMAAGGGPDWNALSDVEKRARVLDFLLQEREGVQRFHMGNGAIIGDIKLDADSVGRFRVMVNYMYGKDIMELTANAAAFRKAASPVEMLQLVSPCLLAETEMHKRYRAFARNTSAPGAAPA